MRFGPEACPVDKVRPDPYDPCPMFDDLTEPLLSMVALTLVVCLLLVVAMAAIGRDRDGIRVGLVFAAVFAVVCVVTQIEEVLGWVLLTLFIALLFGGYT